MNATIETIKRPSRKFLPEDFKVTSWEVIKPYFDNLLQRQIKSLDDLKKWFLDRSELEAIISEDLAWRYIKMTCYTENKDYLNAYQDFIQNIQPQIAPVSDQLNKKAADSEFLSQLAKQPGYDIMIRSLKKEIEIFREENVALYTEISTEAQRYAQINGAMTVNVDGKELTLQQASVFLMSTDRKKREEVYIKIAERRLKDQEQLDQLFSKLIQLRHQVAVNAGFKNFRDYMFKSLGRFDYTPEDCFKFHEAIQHEVVPLLNEFASERKQSLKVDKLRPWDKAVDPEGREALKPFTNGKELTDKTINVFQKLDQYLGQCLSIMKEMGHLDLESRIGKAPGGYNYPLSEIGVPFIFMNATSTLRDMVTIMHEGGHAIHNFLTRDLELNDFKSTPSEVAELASMSMELISMDHWEEFFSNSDDLKRAKREHLEDLIETLPWVATIDKFQHWIYENPNHTVEERKTQWNKIFDQFSDTVTDWSALQSYKDYLWHKQLHLFEVPFYYIEYGMAQLGAVAVWRNFRKDRQKGLEGYQNALKLGYMKSIPEIYKAANIKFDFSREYIKELMGFVRQEIAKI
ncbi:M3 family oligoendopeptidase [Chryseosolibacter indicus]|uniref:M3 family oligoendopeptidase n=1 Tax=Chryseosolibacter indicus TaxID=2782351 RepID=A0ABS5VZW1_9BACT|nr:M3 family oligoendopeptidase [Chryseosolibacter indicus]MBT1706400.1 M3 family oligoendopeptidase [Chryseosolibacter indicus]